MKPSDTAFDLTKVVYDYMKIKFQQDEVANAYEHHICLFHNGRLLPINTPMKKINSTVVVRLYNVLLINICK